MIKVKKISKPVLKAPVKTTRVDKQFNCAGKSVKVTPATKRYPN